MSAEPTPIVLATDGDPVGLDYAALLTEGTALVQRLTGQIWTN